MARKSQAQRLDDAKATLKLWEDAGLSQAKPALFISQMVQSMERGRYPSAGQRKWLDSLTEEGVNAFPVIHNPEKLDEIDKAIATDAMEEKMVSVLRDFRYKLSRGWSLSEKQEAFLSSLLEQAQSLREDGLPELTEDETYLLESLLRYGSTIGRNDYYGYQQGKASFIQDVKRYYEKHGSVTTRHIESLRKMFKGPTKALTEERFSIGDLVPAAGLNGIVMSKVYVDDNGGIMIDIMARGKLKAVPYKSVGKRLLKNEQEGSFWAKG